MTTNEKIAKWLGLKFIGKPYELEIYEGPKSNYKYATQLDFLHDRNQQKWIEDRLEELGYTWISAFNGKYHFFTIMKRFRVGDTLSKTRGDDEDLTFIQAVEQLIDKETSEK